jgi:hypothetical protein
MARAHLARRDRVALVDFGGTLHWLEPAFGTTAADAVGYQLWKLQREALRTRLQALGIGIAVWDDRGLLDAGLEGANSFRRSTGRAARA